MSSRRSSTSDCRRSRRRGACPNERRLDGAHQRAEAPTCAAPERVMTEPRRIMPLPLGGGELGLPYSRGLMARSLMAAGVAAHRAYALATRVGDELAERGTQEIEIARLEELAVDVLGEA